MKFYATEAAWYFSLNQQLNLSAMYVTCRDQGITEVCEEERLQNNIMQVFTEVERVWYYNIIYCNLNITQEDKTLQNIKL